MDGRKDEVGKRINELNWIELNRFEFCLFGTLYVFAHSEYLYEHPLPPPLPSPPYIKEEQ